MEFPDNGIQQMRFLLRTAQAQFRFGCLYTVKYYAIISDLYTHTRTCGPKILKSIMIRLEWAPFETQCRSAIHDMNYDI